MTKADQPKLPPLPLLLVYGKPTSPDIPQASWFRIEERLAVRTAAHALKFTVIDVSSEDDRPLLEGVHEGVLKGNGRMIVGSVSVESYQRIEEHCRVRAGDSGLPAAGSDAAKEKSTFEQNTNNVNAAPVADKAAKEGKDGQIAAKSEPAPASKPIAQTIPDPWGALGIGSHVVVKDWDKKGDAIGWWLGTITGFDKQDFVIVWIEDLKRTAPLKVERKHVAILHPSFDVKSEWDRKPTRRS